MKTHVAMVHEKKKPFKCDICYYSCSLKSTMKIHVASVHEEKKAIQMWHLWLQLFFLFVCSDLAISMSKWIICVICDPASKLKSCEILLLGPLYVKKKYTYRFPSFWDCCWVCMKKNVNCMWLRNNCICTLLVPTWKAQWNILYKKWPN